jgi:hypothetical protein
MTEFNSNNLTVFEYFQNIYILNKRKCFNIPKNDIDTAQLECKNISTEKQLWDESLYLWNNFSKITKQGINNKYDLLLSGNIKQINQGVSSVKNSKHVRQITDPIYYIDFDNTTLSKISKECYASMYKYKPNNTMCKQNSTYNIFDILNIYDKKIKHHLNNTLIYIRHICIKLGYYRKYPDFNDFSNLIMHVLLNGKDYVNMFIKDTLILDSLVKNRNYPKSYDVYVSC